MLDFYDYYATFDFKLIINDAKNIISLTQNTTIKIEFDYELTEYNWEQSDTKECSKNGVYVSTLYILTY